MDALLEEDIAEAEAPVAPEDARFALFADLAQRRLSELQSTGASLRRSNSMPGYTPSAANIDAMTRLMTRMQFNALAGMWGRTRSATTFFESEAAREAALEGIRVQAGTAIGDFLLRVTPSAPGSAAERIIATRSPY